jgi:uncharacterized protein related to proFAR isomerase
MKIMIVSDVLQENRVMIPSPNSKEFEPMEDKKKHCKQNLSGKVNC